MKIAGIDLGKHSIKIIEIESAFGKTEILDYHERKLEKDHHPAAVAVQMLMNLSKPPERIGVALPQSETTFRDLRLPTKDRKAIKSAVAFELEDELPFDLEKAVYDYTILNQGSAGSHIHIAATLKKYVAELISEFNDYGLDPDIITSETWAYRTLLNRVFLKEPQAEPILLAQMGKERTTIYLQWNGTPVLAQEIPWGGQNITRAIEEKYKIAPEAAERAKLNNGFVLTEQQKTNATQEQNEFSDTIYEAMKPLLVELRQTALACKNHTHRYISAAYLSGRPALMPGIRLVVEETIRTRVRSLHAFSAITSSGVKYSEETEAAFLLAAAIGLTAAGPEKATSIDFRRGDLAKARAATELDLGLLKRPLMAVAAVLGCFLLSLTVQSNYYEKRMEELDGQVRRSATAIFGPMSPRAFQSKFPTSKDLKKSVQEKIRSMEEASRFLGSDPRSPLDFLKGLSEAIPKGPVVVDMTEFTTGASPEKPYDEKATPEASLTFLVQTPQMAEALKTHLETVMDNLKQSELKPVASPDGDGEKLQVNFTGVPKEKAYE